MLKGSMIIISKSIDVIDNKIQPTIDDFICNSRDASHGKIDYFSLIK